MQPSDTPRRIAIIGGGLSGTLTAIQLLRQCRHTLHIDLIEKNAEVGLGVAYGTTFAEHLLNVPAKNMSLFPDEPAHFHRWLEQIHPGQYEPESFVPRMIYGHYVQQTWQTALRNKPEAVSVAVHQAQAEVVTPENPGIRIKLDPGSEIVAGKAVLALGNFSPTDPVAVQPEWVEENRYVPNPWTQRAYDSLASLQNLLLIGSGLTALDVIMAACKQGFRGKFHLVSSHGRLPLPYTDANYGSEPTRSAAFLSANPTVRELIAYFKQERYRRQGNWQAVMRALRPLVPTIWQKMPLPEKKLFLLRVSSIWNVHRHRVSEQVIRTVGLLRQTGRLFNYKGRVTSLHRDQATMKVQVRNGQGHRCLSADRVINCTGPCSDIERIARTDSLIRSLLQTGSARPDALRMGFDATPDGQLLDAVGNPSPFLYTLGPPMKGILFECTAVPEIREQAQVLATRLLG
ncbi:MAG: FAD/NAD(P)-binding protein [Cytophagales bacterium]|nr:FAD/NAD(P)-binding protein [Cytophagales bacterium]